MKDELTHKEVVTRGGNSFLKKYGKKKYAEMGKKGHEGKLKKYGPDYYKNLSKAAFKAKLDSGKWTQEVYDKAVAKLESKPNPPDQTQ